MTSFDADRKGTGTKEWAEEFVNISIGCANDCLYCYAAHKAATMYGGWCKREDWPNERFNTRAGMKSYPKKVGVVMFPTTHDITPFTVTEYIRVAKLVLKSGNDLLIVTKPRFDCVMALLRELAPWKGQILFRFTIGTTNITTSRFWEPGAPLPAERLDSLRLAWNSGFSTSVSIEPMLEGRFDVASVIAAVTPYVTDTIWIGKMNKANLRVPKGHEKAVALVHQLQSDTEIIKLYNRHKANPMIRWKDSIKEVVAKSAAHHQIEGRES